MGKGFVHGSVFASFYPMPKAFRGGSMSQRMIAVVIASGLFTFSGLIGSLRGGANSGGNNAPTDLISKLAAAKKPAVGEPLVINGQTVCGPKGNAPDQKMQELNNNKNRTDEPGSNDYIPVSWDDLKNLPGNKVNQIQGAPVVVTGYLSNKVKEQTAPPGETTNCNLLQSNEVDWHMYLTKQPNQPIKNAIVVESTPRVRPNHNWTIAMLTPYVNKNKQVRIGGWLMYDFQHLDKVGTQRATVWEVHPITRIEVQDAQGNWVNIGH